MTDRLEFLPKKKKNHFFLSKFLLRHFPKQIKKCCNPVSPFAVMKISTAFWKIMKAK